MNDNFSIHDTMLLPVTFSQISLLLQNTRPENLHRFYFEVKKMLEERVEDALEDMELHWSEIWADAFPDDDEKEVCVAAGWTRESVEKLALNIYEWLISHNIWQDVSIYYNNRRMSTGAKIDGKWEFRYNGKAYIEDGINPLQYFPCCLHNHVMAMSFEGPLCEILYYGTNPALSEEFHKLLADHDCYFEFNDHWNGTILGVNRNS